MVVVSYFCYLQLSYLPCTVAFSAQLPWERVFQKDVLYVWDQMDQDEQCDDHDDDDDAVKRWYEEGLSLRHMSQVT